MKLPLVSATDPAAQPELLKLDREMARFYNSAATAQYYAQAHAANQTWDANSYHQLVKRACQPGWRVIDLGCGSGHAAINLADRQIEYTGVDWSVDRIQANASTYPETARFVTSPLYQVDLPGNSFDLSFSFYVLEHLVWPHRFLSEMVRLTRSGGLIVIECPHFRLHDRIPSLRYGRSVGSLSQKLRNWKLLDAAQHLWQRSVAYPNAIRRHFPREQFPFLTNLKPSCLSGVYYADNDAVYFVDRAEVISELTRLGCIDVSKQVFRDWHRPIPDDPCVVIVRKT